MNPSLKYWLATLSAPHIGACHFAEVCRAVPDLSMLFTSHTLPEVLRNFPPETQAYFKNPDWELVDAALNWQQKPHHYILTLADETYPTLLKTIADPPPILFVIGQVALLNDPQLAIVGSRKMTSYGRDIAFEFAHTLAAMGLTITSGLALGIDARAHEGALASQGHTIAVLGNGIDQIYPPQHLKLAHQIAEQGCLVSAFPLGTAPAKTTFPQRNRVITGLSLGTLVIEAALHSGSLVSARLAMEQGREVFAIPGSIHNPMSKGCHWLLQQGAKLVQSTEDILNELKLHIQPHLIANAPVIQQPQENSEQLLDQEYQQLLNELGTDPIAVDRLVERTGLSVPVLSSMLLMLEMQNRIENTSIGYIIKH